MVLIGSFFLRVVLPLPAHSPMPNAYERSASDSSTLLKRTKSGDSRYSAERLSHEPGTQPESISYHDDAPKDSMVFEDPIAPNQGMSETSSLLSKSSGSDPGDIPYQNASATAAADRNSHHVDIRGVALVWHMEFYQLWLLLGLLTGIGLMTIKYVRDGIDMRESWLICV